jgi:enoyl-CoA hydratase/carnithine racemase
LAVAQHLPQGRCQAGDRHLKFYGTRDNLRANVLTCSCRGRKPVSPTPPAPPANPRSQQEPGASRPPKEEFVVSVVMVEKREGVGLVRLNDPSHLNPLSNAPGGMNDQIAEALGELEADESIRAVVICGAGRAFCAGADTRRDLMAEADNTPVDARIRRMLAKPTRPESPERGWALWNCLSNYSKPMVAAVEGPAIGGGWELALWCDLIIADTRATFGFPEIRFGYTAPFGALLATRVVGIYLASELLLTSRTISADEAFRMGLVSSVVPDGEALSTALTRAKAISDLPTVTVALMRRAIRRGAAISSDDWEANQREFVLAGLSESGGSQRSFWLQSLRNNP